MDLKSATQRIADYLKEVFGRVVELREVAVERSASGRIWMGTVYCVTRLGDVEVGKVGVTVSKVHRAPFRTKPRTTFRVFRPTVPLSWTISR
jgi:hypothetical protein